MAEVSSVKFAGQALLPQTAVNGPQGVVGTGQFAVTINLGLSRPRRTSPSASGCAKSSRPHPARARPATECSRSRNSSPTTASSSGSEWAAVLSGRHVILVHRLLEEYGHHRRSGHARDNDRGQGGRGRAHEEPPLGYRRSVSLRSRAGPLTTPDFAASPRNA